MWEERRAGSSFPRSDINTCSSVVVVVGGGQWSVVGQSGVM